MAGEECIDLRQFNRVMKEPVKRIPAWQGGITYLPEWVKELQEHLARCQKISLPPPPDRFVHPGMRRRRRKPAGPDHIRQVHIRRSPISYGEYSQAEVAVCQARTSERRQVIDCTLLLFRQGRRSQLEAVAWPFPCRHARPGQYGPHASSRSEDMTTRQLVPRPGRRGALIDVFVVVMSEGTLTALTTQAASHLLSITPLRQARGLHYDGTGLDVPGERLWLLVICRSGATLSQMYRSREDRAQNEIGSLANVHRAASFPSKRVLCPYVARIGMFCSRTAMVGYCRDPTSAYSPCNLPSIPTGRRVEAAFFLQKYRCVGRRFSTCLSQEMPCINAFTILQTQKVLPDAIPHSICWQHQGTAPAILSGFACIHGSLSTPRKQGLLMDTALEATLHGQWLLPFCLATGLISTKELPVSS